MKLQTVIAAYHREHIKCSTTSAGFSPGLCNVAGNLAALNTKYAADANKLRNDRQTFNLDPVGTRMPRLPSQSKGIAWVLQSNCKATFKVFHSDSVSIFQSLERV